MAVDARRFPALNWLLLGCFLLWLALVLAAYYWVQNAYLQPLLSSLARSGGRWLAVTPSAAAMGSVALDLLAALGLAWAALGAGLWLLERLLPEDAAPAEAWAAWERMVLGMGLGWGAVGLLVLGLGLAGALNRPVFLALFTLLALASGRRNLALLRRLPRPRPPRALAVYLMVAGGLALTLALLPPTDWDGLFYHLTGPRLYLEAGQIRPGVDIPHLNFPSLLEMHFLSALALRGDVAAKLVHFSFVFLLAVTVYLTARRRLGLKSGWTAVMFLFSLPMALDLAAWAYNDLALAFYALVALYAFLAAGETGWEADGRRWLVVSGVMAGLAMSLKYTSFVVPAALTGLYLWRVVRGRSGVASIGRFALTFLLPAAVVAGPWYLKNLAFTGNPVYPFAFGGRFWDEFRATAYTEAGTGIGYDPAGCAAEPAGFLVGQYASGCPAEPLYLASRLLTLPIELTLELPDANRHGPSGPLFLLFLPLLAVLPLTGPAGRRPAALMALLGFALAHYLFWVAGVVASAALWQSRLLLPMFVALCPALAWVYDDLARLDRPQFSLRRLLRLVIGLALAAALLIRFLQWLPYQPWGYLLGGEGREEYLTRMLGDHYRAMQAINEQLPAGSVVAFLWEPRSYYCQRDCRPDSILDKFGHLLYRHGDAAGMAAAWRLEGVSHVLLNRRGLELVLAAVAGSGETRAEPAARQQLLADFLVPVETVGGYELYALRP